MTAPRASTYPTKSPSSEDRSIEPEAPCGTMGGQNRGMEANTNGRASTEPILSVGVKGAPVGSIDTVQGEGSGSLEPYGNQIAPKGQGGLTGGV
jgi:hypothetical protein